jgi:hypothetical protein
VKKGKGFVKGKVAAVRSQEQQRIDEIKARQAVNSHVGSFCWVSSFLIPLAACQAYKLVRGIFRSKASNVSVFN